MPAKADRNPFAGPAICGLVVALYVAMPVPVTAEQTVCFESREGSSEIVQQAGEDGTPNVICSGTTGAVLLWKDPLENTIPLAAFPDGTRVEGAVRPRTGQLTLFPVCGVACHNGQYPVPVQDKSPRRLVMHTDLVPDALDLQHGRGEIWCLDCHHAEDRTKLVDHRGEAIDFNQPQQLCGKCHGPAYRDWRAGIHGKRLGEWKTGGVKRWFVCTECHDPHDVQQGNRNSGFARILSEPPQPPP